MRRTLALSVITVLLAAANAFAGAEARMNGKILDKATGQPIADAVVKLAATSPKTVQNEAKTKKDGTYAVFVLDGTINYTLTVAANGYVTYQEQPFKLKLGEPNKKDIELTKLGAAGAPGGAAPEPDPAATAYNEGAQLANSGKPVEAIAKFEEAVAKKPTLTPAWIALAKVQFKQKNHAKAIEAAKKALEIDDEDVEMWSVLAQSYAATGDKANAAAAQKKLPANAGQLFNDAAALINKGNDGDAEPLLKQAIAADAKMSLAYYELGMIYVRSGNSADAKTNLEKYLELDPNGKDSATAKEMLKYLK